MNNKLLFPDFENIIIAGEIPTAIENGYTYLEQVMALRKYVLSLGKYTKDLTTIVNNNTDDITKLKAFKHITHLGTKEGDIFKLEELKDDLYYADTQIFIQYKIGYLAYFKKGALITKSSGISENEEYSKLENVLQHQATGYIDGTITTTYNVYNSTTKEILDANTSSINISELNTKLDNYSNEISDLQTKVIQLTNSITTINGILENTSHIEHISENANLWELNAGIYKATTNLSIKISSDASVTDEPINVGQIFMIQSSNNDEWEMWYTDGTNIMYAQTYLESGIYEGSRKSINVRTITSKVEDLENRVTNLEKAPKDQSIFIEFNESTDTIIPKLQIFVDNFRKDIVTPVYWYYTSGDLLELSKIVNNLDNTAGRRMNLYFTAFDSTTLTNKQIPVGNMLINLDLTTYNITNITKNWEYQTIESGSDLPIASKTTLGGVKIGDGIDVTPDGTISTTKTYFIDTENIDTNILAEIRTNINNDKPFYVIASGIFGKFICTGYDYDKLIFTSFGSYTDEITKETINLGNGTNEFKRFSIGKMSKQMIFEYNLTSSENIKSAIDLITSSNVFDENPSQSYNLLFRFDTTDTQKYGLPLCTYSVPVLNGSENNYEFGMIEGTTLYVARLTRHYENEVTTYTYQKLSFALSASTENTNIESSKKFSFDFLFTDDAIDSVSSYNSSSYIMTGITKAFDVNEIYGELMVKYSEVVSGTTYSSVCPADRLKYMLTNVSDVDYSFRALSDGTSQLTLHIRRTDETQAFTSPTGMKIENIFINGYLLDSTEDISKSTTITKN